LDASHGESSERQKEKDSDEASQEEVPHRITKKCEHEHFLKKPEVEEKRDREGRRRQSQAEVLREKFQRNVMQKVSQHISFKI
jgi:hypothetical protein